MTRYPIRVCLVLALSLVLPSARAEQRPKELAIKKVRVGFPAGVEEGKFKSGFWTPVYVELEAGPQPIAANQYAVVVQTADVDDVNNRYVVPVPTRNAGEAFTLITCTKPACSFAEITVSVQELAKGEADKPAQVGRTIDTFGPDNTFHSIKGGNTLYLAVGSRLSGLQDSIAPPGGSPDQNAQLAFLDDVQQMPTQWFAYAPVDLVILCTSKKSFINDLATDRERWNALAEWLRRGGHLVISAGHFQNLVADLDKQQPLLPMTVTGDKTQLPAAGGVEEGMHLLTWGKLQTIALQEPRDRDGNRVPILLAKLEPKFDGDKEGKAKFPRPTKWLVPNTPGEGPPVMVRGPYGLGQITLVAFDLEQMPFKDKASETAFWRNFRDDLGAERSAANENPQQMAFTPYGNVSNDLASKLQQNLEYFEDIPVIGFGWVALFILLYILVVGPLDYFFLKKVVKRLELTWITFPAVVIFISVVAYFVAYWIKGDKLKINKVDVVDVDLHTEQVHGNTWFTLFSPRIEHYTIGIEPVAPQWAPGGPKDASPLVSWMDRPETNSYGSGRSRGQSLFRRTYDYETDAAGLRGVPIQVWSTKSFAASWEAPAQRSLISHKLHRLADDDRWIGGTITSHLPVDLEDVVVFYRGDCYSLGKLPRETETRLGEVKRNSRNLESWFSFLNTGVTINPYQRRGGASDTREPAESIVRALAFYDALPQSQRSNLRDTSLRYLDQTWRLRHIQDEVILFGRVPVQQGDAQTVAQNPGSPSRLWLRDLPQADRPWPGLSGTLRQETFVRIYVPVAANAEDAGP
jgi:hypothetical protein